MWTLFCRQLLRSAARLVLAFGLFGLISALPWPAASAQWVGIVSSAALVAALVLIMGKLLVDTLFFARYWRQMDSR